TYVRRSYELYPTAIVAALALMALVTRYRDRTVRLGAALVLVGIAFSLGPSPEGSAFVSPYDLVRRLPGLSRVVRAGPARGRGRRGAGPGRLVGAGGAGGGRRPSRRRAPSRRPATPVPASSPDPGQRALARF